MDNTSKTQVTVALIGLVGVLGTALIANWSSIVGSKSAVDSPGSSKPVVEGSRSSAVDRPDSRPAIDRRNSTTTDEKAEPSTFELSDYLGEWRNRDPNTRGITRVSLHKNGPVLQAQVWGRCHPTDCDWGTTTATPFAKGVGSRSGSDVVSVEAVFKKSFAESRLVIRLLRDRTLTVETSTHFTDNSGRSDYRSADTFVRGR